MYDSEQYWRNLTTISTCIVTLLGSVGIFVSLVINRKVNKLQDIFDQFLELTFDNYSNSTAKLHNLIEQYQMHYIMPNTPKKSIEMFLNLGVLSVLFSWTYMVYSIIDRNQIFSFRDMLLIIPLILSMIVLIFYRKVILSIVDPTNSAMLKPIIPKPSKLRSISYLSNNINVSIQTVLKQCRIAFEIDLSRNSNHHSILILKEQLSFDDYYYYLTIFQNDKVIFVGYGQIKFVFAPDPITKKPIPIKTNINVPLGNIEQSLSKDNLNGIFLIFTSQDKHPIQGNFELIQKNDLIFCPAPLELTTNHFITYEVVDAKLNLIKIKGSYPYLQELLHQKPLQNRRYWLDLHSQEIKHCILNSFIK